MSQADAPTLAQIIPLLTILDTSLLIELASTALYCYDYSLTFSQEVKCVWQRKLSGPSLLFLMNRYVVLLNRLVRLVQLVSWTGWKETQADTACNAAWRISEACTALMYLVIAGFSALRMYAIYNKSRRVLASVLLMGMVNPFVSIYYSTALTIQAMPPPFRGCGQQSKFNNPTVDLMFFLFGAIFSILTEAIVLALTWSRTADIAISLRKMKRKVGLAQLLCRDGTVYFLVLLTLTCLSMVSIPDQMFNNIPALTDTLSSICLARFMLNLRAISLTNGARGSKGSSLLLSDVRFASCAVVGNLGAPIGFATRREPGEDDDDDDDDDDERPSAGKGDDQDDRDREEVHHVSDDPLATGIVADMDGSR